MKPKQLISLLALSVALSSLGEDAKGASVDSQNNGKPHPYWMPPPVKEPLTLLGKRLEVQQMGPAHKKAYFYLSTDGVHTNYVAQKYVPCCTTEELYQSVQIGDTMTIKDWDDRLKHLREERCMGLKSITPEMEKVRHKFWWQYVKPER